MDRGTRLSNRFVVDGPVGAGAMGVVYRATDTFNGQLVAIKVMRPSLSPLQIARFEREAAVLSELQHANIVRYVAQGHAGDERPYLVMEWLEGETLRQRLKTGPLSVADCVTLARQLGSGLLAAHHRGILHRDIKPANIMLVSGSIDAVKLLDFGIARVSEASVTLTETGVPIGTPAYMSPEQVRGLRDLDVRTDVYGMGCVLFRALAGRTPLVASDVPTMLIKVVMEDPPPLTTIVPEVGAPLGELVDAMLAKSPEKRPASVPAVVEALLAIDKDALVPDSSRATSLTRAEERLTCLLLVGALASATVAATLKDAAADPGRAPARSSAVTEVVALPVDGTPPTRISRGLDAANTRTDPACLAADERRAAVVAVIAHFGGELHELLDGSLLVSLTGSSAAVDLARRAARCALQLRTLCSPMVVAMVTGRAAQPRSEVGALIERATGRLRCARAEAVRIDGVTAELLDARFEVAEDELGHLLTRERRDDESIQLPPNALCVGRERELAILEGLMEECCSEPMAQTALMTGVAGIGKSRVTHAFLQRVVDEWPRAQVWIGHADPMAVDTPLFPIARALRRAFAIDEGQPRAEARERLRDAVAGFAPADQRSRVAAFLGEIIGVPFPDEENVGLRAARQNHVLGADQMRRAFEDALVGVCRKGPLVLVLEDLHWCDAASIQFIDAALRHLEDHPFLVVASGRETLSERFPVLWKNRRVQHIRLNALTRRASERLAERLAGADRDADQRARVVEVAGGNPFYLEALLHDARTSGGHEALPDTLLAAVGAQLERVPADARRVMRAASVFGQSCWRSGIEALLGVADRRLGIGDALQELVDRDVLVQKARSHFSTESQYAFRHALVQQAAYAMLTDRDRRVGHRLAARWLERTGEQNAAKVAHHFERAQHVGRAAGWLERAARQKLRSNDLTGAILLADRAIAAECPQPLRGQLWLLKAEAHRWRGGNDAAYAAGRQAMTCFEVQSRAWFSAAGQAAAAAGKLGKVQALVNVAEAMVSGSSIAHGAIEVLQAYARASTPLLLAGQYPLLARMLAPLALVPPSDDPATAAWLHRAQSLREWVAGDVAAYLRASEDAAKSFAAADDTRNACSQHLAVGIGAIEVGAYGRAKAALHNVLSQADRMRLAHHAAVAQLQLAIVAADTADHARACELIGEACTAFETLEDPRMEGAARLELARVLLTQGDGVTALAEAQRGAELTAEWPAIAPYALAIRANARHAAQVPNALDDAREAHRRLTQLGRLERGAAYVRWTHASLQSGDRGASAARGRQHLEERARAISDPALRRSFLERVPDNLKLLALSE